MLRNLIIAAAAFVLALLAVTVYLNRKSAKNVEKYLLPEGSDKESFTDPKTGKTYDKEAYCNNLRSYVKNFNNQQLQSVYNARKGHADIWNQLLAEAAHEELLRRANTSPEDTETVTAAIEEIEEEIAPFFWVEQQIGASIGLNCGTYLQELFEENKMLGNGYDWEKLAEVFLKDHSDLSSAIQFDSEADMFCAYSRDEQALQQFARKFHAACEDDEAAEALFARLQK